MKRRLGELDMSTIELSRQSGLSRKGVYNVLDGEVDATIDTLRRLSRPLRVHSSVLIGKLYSDYVRPIHKRGRPEKYKYFDSGYVADVNYPDNSQVATNQEFEKIWEIQNTGKEAWKDIFLVNTNDPTMPGYLKPEYTSISLPIVEPGQTIQITIKFKAPNLAGTVISRWKMFDSDGVMVFPDKEGIWCQVEVVDV